MKLFGIMLLISLFTMALKCGTDPVPQPSPTPTPNPTVAPNSSPSPAKTCPLKLDNDHYLSLNVAKRGTARLILDLTPSYCGLPLPTDFPLKCGTKCCTLGVDSGDNGLLCEAALVGTPQWSVVDGDVELVPQDNPFLEVVKGSGTVKVCSQTNPSVCQSVVVP